MSTEIKRLKQQGQDFVPITLAEAVVVNTNNIPGFESLSITTLDKVLSALGISIDDFNDALADKQDTLIAGAGITILNGVISTSAVTTLYKIVTVDLFSTMTPGEEYLNVIYLIPVSSVSGNSFSEQICVAKTETVGETTTTTYFWEKLGEVQTEVDLSGYVTLETFNSFIVEAVTATNITTSEGLLVIVTYNIPTTLYDSMVESNEVTT